MSWPKIVAWEEAREAAQARELAPQAALKDRELTYLELPPAPVVQPKDSSIISDQTPEDTGQDQVRVTSEQVQAATPTPKPSVPNTAMVPGQNGQPIQIPIEFLVIFFLGSLGALTLANVKAVRRRR